MRVVELKSAEEALALEDLAAPAGLFDPEIEHRTRGIIDGVRERGDAAVCEFTERFDRASLTPDQLAVTTAELLTASLAVDAALRRAVAEAKRNIGGFARRSLRKDWSMRNSHGAVVGEKFDPIQRVGVYVPGGSAPLVSTALMTVTLAAAAGCEEIVVCTPGSATGEIHSALLFAARTAGATEIYRIGGAQAVAAMALGTATIRRVHKLFGPGNAYVVAAKRLLYGYVAVDLLPGPSEVCVLADDTADARWIAADLLAQAEHGSGHERVWLVTASRRLAAAVQGEIQRQEGTLSRRDAIARALTDNGRILLAPDLAAGIAVVNRLAPEHCEVMVRQPQAAAAKIRTAGAVFIGGLSPTVLGDYVAGPSHTLPTGGSGRGFSGLTADQFQRRTSVIEYSRPALRKALPAARQFAAVEGLDAHGASAAIRLAPASSKPARPKTRTKRA